MSLRQQLIEAVTTVAAGKLSAQSATSSLLQRSPGVPVVTPGLSTDALQKSATALLPVFAGTYVLYTATQGAHWNVTGPAFGALHSFFQTQYESLSSAVDDVAERIRALGFGAPGTLKEILELAPIKERRRVGFDATTILQYLVDGHQELLESIRNAFKIATDVGDEATANFLADRDAQHSKMLWMLRSHLV